MKLINQESVTLLSERLLTSGGKLAPRTGKTRKMHESGKIRRNELNKQKRGEWTTRVSKEHGGGKSHPFPIETCSGKRHRPAGFKAKRKAGPRKNRV